MYVIEFFLKLKADFKEKTGIFNFLNKKIEKDDATCQHVFAPVDSTSEVLACTKCGLVVRKSELERMGNFFVKQ